MQQHVADAAQELSRLIVSYQNCDVTVSYSVFSGEYQSVFIEKPIKEVKNDWRTLNTMVFFTLQTFLIPKEYETKLPLYSIESTRNEEFAELDI